MKTIRTREAIMKPGDNKEGIIKDKGLVIVIIRGMEGEEGRERQKKRQRAAIMKEEERNRMTTKSRIILTETDLATEDRMVVILLEG